MAASPPTTTPKAQGRHLRDVRRRKGLSLSEVARGAGLSRRELVNYERGKTPIPESDLWVLAGSCGVDVGELLPQETVPELEAGPASIGESIAQLRRVQDDEPEGPYVASLRVLQAVPPGGRVPLRGRELDAIAQGLGGERMAVEAAIMQMLRVDRDEAARLRAMLVPDAPRRRRPRALAAAPAPEPEPVAPVTPTVDNDNDTTDLTDGTAAAAAAVIADTATPAPPPEPGSPVAPPWIPAPEWVPDNPTGVVDVFEELARLPEPVPLNSDPDEMPDLFAPRDLSVPPPDPSVPPPPGTVEAVDDQPIDGLLATTGGPADDQPVLVDPVSTADDEDDGTPWTAADAPPIDVASRPEPLVPPDMSGPEEQWQTPAGAAWDPAWPSAWETNYRPEPGESAEGGFWDEPESGALATEVPAAAWGAAGFAAGYAGDHATADLATPDALLEPRPEPGSATVPWSHDPDPEAVSTGFLVDWGAPAEAPDDATDAGPDADLHDGPLEPLPWETATPLDDGPLWETTGGFEDAPPWEPAMPADDGLAPISWRPTVDVLEADERLPEPVAHVTPASAPDGTAPDAWIAAGDDWELGNALPLVEIRSHGDETTRRADERWALADLTTPDRYALEVDLEFRGGPGFGVLFRSTVDDNGRMSGYSFDVDPGYDGGGYLVRQWQADRELWNPIAQETVTDADAMYGRLTVRLVVDDGRMVAYVNDAEVLRVDDLEEASQTRGRLAPSGRRVGVQAWSSSDLVIDTVKLAAR
jgi:transcriptional regulator with XRE-family HTH domain